MDLDSAISAHVGWRMKFRTAMARKERLDVATIESPLHCDLGKWIAGEGRAKHGASPLFDALRRSHEAFHRAAGAVAAAVCAGDCRKAEAMLESGTEYTQASVEVAKAVQALQSPAP